MNLLPVALAILLVSPALGQAQKRQYSVTGSVRNTWTGEPVKNALVILYGMASGTHSDDPQGGPAQGPHDTAMLSGPGGEFQFDGLREGQYSVSAHRPGFSEHDSNSPIALTIPRSPADAPIHLRLTPLGAMEGTVVNQYGEPLEEVLIAVYALGVLDGERSARDVGSVWTDDRGYFHLAYVEPGKYCVKARGRKGGTETHVGTKDIRYAPWEAFSPVYFGGATSIESAAAISVAAGAHVRTDFTLELLRRPLNP